MTLKIKYCHLSQLNLKKATRVLGQSESSFFRWFSAQRVSLGTFGTVAGGAGLDAAKDKAKEKMEEHLPGAAKHQKE